VRLFCWFGFHVWGETVVTTTTETTVFGGPTDYLVVSRVCRVCEKHDSGRIPLTDAR